jgi:hypothetical protein
MRKEIDFEVMTGLLQELGWRKVVLSPMTHEKGEAIDRWVKDNCKDRVHTMGLVWVFENDKEANWFTLKWA